MAMTPGRVEPETWSVERGAWNDQSQKTPHAPRLTPHDSSPTPHAPLPTHSDLLDPALAWQPWRPTAADPWGRKWAAHLYRRAAFGPNREELIEAERLGFENTLELLLRGRPDAGDAEETLSDVGRIVAGRDNDGVQLRGWWLYCILNSAHPLREKMTVFWHNHFATSLAKVQDPILMFRQNCLLRENALGKLGPLVQGVSRDAAMLIWLDSNANVRGKPNENYARELMELFTLGVGHYSEKDIREAARAFTGWHSNGSEFKFDARLHDGGTKTVLGRTGDWNGDDVVRIVLAQPAAARFIVRKLYHYLISEKVEPADRLLEPLAEAFRKSDYDIAGLVRTMVSSRLFFSEHAFRQRIKSPVEYLVGAVRAVYRRYKEDEPDYRPLPQQDIVGWLPATGQALFAPPNVKGWPGGRSWLNTSTMLARDNFAAALATGSLWAEPTLGPVAPAALLPLQSPKPAAKLRNDPVTTDLIDTPEPPKALDPVRLLEEEGVSRPEEIVRVLLNLYVPGGVPESQRTALVAFVAERNSSGPALQHRVREAVHAILTMAEYQLA